MLADGLLRFSVSDFFGLLREGFLHRRVTCDGLCFRVAGFFQGAWVCYVAKRFVEVKCSSFVIYNSRAATCAGGAFASAIVGRYDVPSTVNVLVRRANVGRV